MDVIRKNGHISRQQEQVSLHRLRTPDTLALEVEKKVAIEYKLYYCLCSASGRSVVLSCSAFRDFDICPKDFRKKEGGEVHCVIF